jgi:hypothetical protein
MGLFPDSMVLRLWAVARFKRAYHPAVGELTQNENLPGHTPDITRIVRQPRPQLNRKLESVFIKSVFECVLDKGHEADSLTGSVGLEFLRA